MSPFPLCWADTRHFWHIFDHIFPYILKLDSGTLRRGNACPSKAGFQPRAGLSLSKFMEDGIGPWFLGGSEQGSRKYEMSERNNWLDQNCLTKVAFLHTQNTGKCILSKNICIRVFQTI